MTELLNKQPSRINRTSLRFYDIVIFVEGKENVILSLYSVVFIN